MGRYKTQRWDAKAAEYFVKLEEALQKEKEAFSKGIRGSMKKQQKPPFDGSKWSERDKQCYQAGFDVGRAYGFLEGVEVAVKTIREAPNKMDFRQYCIDQLAALKRGK